MNSELERTLLSTVEVLETLGSDRLRRALGMARKPATATRRRRRRPS
jgi:hypothetical protein